jgi:hypothetical protein
MKKLLLALAALLLLIGFIGWNVWQAVYEPVTTPPTLVELGHQQLHNQLEQSKTREAEIEKQDWDSITLLRGLIDAHQHRIDQLKDNSQAGEILAHDRDAIARIEKRIADLQAQQAEQAAQPAPGSDQTAGESAPASNPAPKTTPAQPQTTRPAPTPGAPQTTKPAQKTQPQPASPKPAQQSPPQSR